MQLEIAHYESPLGRLVMVTRGKVLCGLGFEDPSGRLLQKLERRYGPTVLTQSDKVSASLGALEAYFAGEVQALDELKVKPRGTEFQMRVWRVLRSVPPGETISYLDLAEAAGCPRGARAVGSANGANPICLVLPCHRVIAADGTLGGYGGGLWRKAWLLRHEGVHVPGMAEHLRECATVAT